MRLRSLCIGVLVAALCAVGLPAFGAINAPTITSVQLSSTAVAPGVGLTVTVATTLPSAWRVDVLSACGGAPAVTLSGATSTPGFTAVWDGADASAVVLSPGSWRVRVTLLDAGGAAVSSAVEHEFTVTGSDSICGQITTFGDGEIFTKTLERFRASGSSSVIVGSATDAGYAAIASSYAHRFGVPLVLYAAKSAPGSLVNAAAARKTKVVIIGPNSAVPSSVDAALKAKRIQTVRLTGSDRPGTAALIAARLRPTESSTAVYASLGGSPSVIAVAAAYANARGVPLLDASAVLPTATGDAITKLRLVGGVVIGDSSDVPDRVVATLPSVTRVIGKDLASTSFALARSLPASASTLVLDAARQADSLALIARSITGEAQLLLPDGDLPTAQRAWLSARADITGIAVSPRVNKPTAIAIARLINDRGVVGVLPALSMRPAPAVAVPALFTFSGSGFGHGVGMSQWGAYGMAKEGRTASEILQHYFTGSLVAPIKDDVDVNVSLHSRVASASFRLEQLADPASTMEMTSAEGAVTTLHVGDVVSTKYAGGQIAVSVSPSANVPAFSTTSLTLRWAGNRDTGTATGGPAILRVAGPGTSITAGSRYRYGIAQVTVAKAGVGVAGLQVNNILRLHDEYLYGIAEVSSSWPTAAVQAQVITARSYAFRKVKAGLRSACACNVYDDPRDQNFTGYAKLAESGGAGARWKAAVDGTALSATQGQALTVGGQVVSAYYSAADGGRTQNNEDVWGGSPLSYTRSVDDRWSIDYAASTVSRWIPRSFTQSQIAAAFGAPDVAFLDLSNRYASGAVDVAVAIASSGQRFELGAETLKSRLNSGLADAEVLARGIPSVWMWRVDTEVPVSGAAAAAQQVNAGSTSINARLPGALSPTVVIVQSDSSVAGPPTLALAAAFAGAQGFGLLVNTTSALDAVLKSDLTRRKAQQVIFIGAVPPGLVTAVNALKISARRIDAMSPPALSALVAAAMRTPIGSPLIITAQRDVASHAIAVSLAARMRAPLVLFDGAVPSSEVSAYLLAAQPSMSIVVGGADAVPDAAVAGLGTVKRLSTGDLKLASIVASSQVWDTSTRAIIVANVLAPSAAAVVAAGTGLPLFYVDAPAAPISAPTPTATSDTLSAMASAVASAVSASLVPLRLPEEVMALVPRLPAFTLVFRVGLDGNAIMSIRNA